ncbi:hypothetical protein T484DRAFT_1879840 [Baffinella frigidus]|nr:hypothetical protein T484DRAFT_1879840 [Cryptophyta sp. CCMP2293]
MAGRETSCAHCGKHSVALKRCLGCLQVLYCGAECQKAARRGHKKTCARREDVFMQVMQAGAQGDAQGVLKWEGRMEELMEGMPDTICDTILHAFMKAHMQQPFSRGPLAKVPEALRLENRRIELLGKMELSRNQGEAMCNAAHMLIFAGQPQDAARSFQRARDVGAAHGFFTVESQACQGLAELFITQERHEEGAELHSFHHGTFRTTLTCITAARVFMYCNQRTNDSIAAEAFNADHFLHVAAEQ